MRQPKVSIIIPVYNAELTLKQCLSSVLNQTYINYEVIVVDNNSNDRTKDITEEFQNRNRKIKYIFENYQSVGAARNTGIKIAKGEILVFTDSDCVAPENWIKELIQPILYENESVATGFEKDMVENFWTKNIQKMDYLFQKRCLNNKGYVPNIDGKNFAIKRALMRKLMFDPKIHMFDDFDLSIRIKELAKIKFMPQVLIGHFHKSSLKKTVKTNFVRAFWATKIFEKYKESKDVRNEPILQSMSIKNFLLFPFWMAFQFVKRPPGEAYFLLVSELAWRAGIIWGYFTRLINYDKIGRTL